MHADHSHVCAFCLCRHCADNSRVSSASTHLSDGASSRSTAASSAINEIDRKVECNGVLLIFLKCMT